MEFETLAQEKVPKIGLGTWLMRGESCRRSVLNALEIGYRHIDTAEYYRNETEVGQAINEAGIGREKLFITSKVWSNHYQNDAVQQACEASLSRLGVDYLDLYLIHYYSEAVPLEETLAGMQSLVDQGKTRFIGVSNFSVAQVARSREITDAPIWTNQVKYHPFHAQDQLLEYCQENGILLTAYTPLDRGGVMRDRTLQRIGRRHEKSPAQVALRWLVQQKGVITIPKASSRKHQQMNLDIFDFQLSSTEMEEIHALG